MTVNEGVIVKATNGVAICGLTLPTWSGALDAMSSTAGQLLPIISLIWLVIQMFFFTRKQIKTYLNKDKSE